MTAVPVSFPRPGEADYVDHAEAALSRLPQQFRFERHDPPIRPLLMSSSGCQIVLDEDTSVQVVEVVLPPEVSPGDCAVLLIASDSVDGVPDETLLLGDWSIASSSTTDDVNVVTVVTHVVGKTDDTLTRLFLQGGSGDTQAVVLYYRHLDSYSPVVDSAAVDVSGPLGGPTSFPCPSLSIPSRGDLYLGLVWLIDGVGAVITPPVGATKVVTTTGGDFTSRTLAVFDAVPVNPGPTGIQTVSINLGVTGVAAGVALRFSLSEFDSLNNVGRLVASLCGPVQDLWDTMMQVLLQRSLDNAVGAQLDVIGKLVKRARGGLDDETYRRYCRATIAAHRSRGTVDELVNIAELVVFDSSLLVDVDPERFGTVRVQLLDIPVTDQLADVVFLFLRQAASAGVRVILQYGNTIPVFRFDQLPGLDQGHLGGEISD